jgi:hypothetical protein
MEGLYLRKAMDGVKGAVLHSNIPTNNGNLSDLFRDGCAPLVAEIRQLPFKDSAWPVSLDGDHARDSTLEDILLKWHQAVDTGISLRQTGHLLVQTLAAIADQLGYILETFFTRWDSFQNAGRAEQSCAVHAIIPLSPLDYPYIQHPLGGIQ